MKNYLNLSDDWEFNVLGVYNFKKEGPYDTFLNFIREKHNKIEGDILEAGVYKGKSICAIAMLLKELGSDKKVYGFDSFSGFPPVYHEKDMIEQFEFLYKKGLISEDHYLAVVRNKEWREHLMDKEITSANISTSGDFSNTSKSIVEKKIKLLGLDNIILVEGSFNETMTELNVAPEKIMAVMMDCDLYSSYLDVFNFVWSRLQKGGFIFLDEYYSLKFPGGKIATDEFIKDKNTKLQQAEKKQGDFERWYLIKE